MTRISRISENAIELRETTSSLAYWLSLRDYLERNLKNVEEVLNTEDSIVIVFHSSEHVKVEVINNLLNRFSLTEKLEEGSKSVHHIEVNYTSKGTDLREVSRQLGITENEVIEIHRKGNYQIAMFGFIPGFVYLTELPVELQLPRKRIPSLHVSKGSVAIAESYTGIYPVDTQGGWHVIGFTEHSFLEVLMRNTQEVLPGDVVNFSPK